MKIKKPPAVSQPRAATNQPIINEFLWNSNQYYDLIRSCWLRNTRESSKLSISMILSVLKEKNDAFILIDEMLRGTNSKDKLNGSIGITKKLLESNAYAMIATHDIKLAEMGHDEKRIANYYFDIDYKDGDLVFDYKVKSGICENFNASFLLGQLGIDTEAVG